MAVPIWTRLAPASMYSSASRALPIPPIPMTGRETRKAAIQVA